MSWPDWLTHNIDNIRITINILEKNINYIKPKMIQQ